MLGLQLPGHLSLHVAAAKVKILIDIVTALLSVDLVCHVGVALHIVIVVIGIIFTTLAFVPDDWGLELESTSKTGLSELEQYEADTLTIARLQLVGVHIDIKSQVLEFNDHILTGGHRVVILVPTGDLVLVKSEQPRDKRDEIDELLRGFA